VPAQRQERHVTDAAMRVSTLTSTPIKGLSLHQPEHVDITSQGIAGDRAFFLVDSDGGLVSISDHGDLARYRAEWDAASETLRVHGPDGLVHEDAVTRGADVGIDFYGLRVVRGHAVPGFGEIFSEILGLPVRLVVGDTGAYDVHGLSVLGTASSRAIAERNDADPVDPRRWRMNIEITTDEPHIEDSWRGRHVRVGDVVVEMGGPVKRCAATTRNPDSGVVDLQTLRMIRTSRGRQETAEDGFGFYFGVYAIPVTTGRVHVGDEVALVP
jgi:uncharacterized protein YcbX